MPDDSLDLVHQQPEHQHQSPFDAIRGYRADGSEFWTARELMRWLGYKNWQNAEKAIARAIKSLNNQGHNSSLYVIEVSKYGSHTGLGRREIKDFELSRLGCYTVAMNADPEKEMVALAQSYFATKTREAEVVIPAQNEQLRELELINENLKMQLEMSRLQDSRIALHGLPITLLLEGKADAVVEVEKPTIEIIDERHNVRFRGQTLVQIKETLQKKYGIRLKTGADVFRALKQLGLEHLVCQTLRSVSSDYIPEENLVQVYQAMANQQYRQMLLGE